MTVNAAGRHILRDKQAVLPSLKSGQGHSSQGLRAISIDHVGVNAFVVQALCNSVCTRPGELAELMLTESSSSRPA
ncbi:MAG TPA: hypothetical protein VMT75_07310 [Candidatus Saccharimonadales bacterium]|nr:hypothetical protein [Candidatus Saccharimonadales bacterium]